MSIKKVFNNTLNKNITWMKNRTLKNKLKCLNYKESSNKYKKMNNFNKDQDLAFKELWKLTTCKIKSRLK